MNIEIQKYYTENKTRIEYLNEEIKNLKSSVNTEELYNHYDMILREETYSKCEDLDIIYELRNLSSRILKAVKYSLRRICQEIIILCTDTEGEEKYWLDRLPKYPGHVHSLYYLEEITNVICNFINKYKEIDSSYWKKESNIIKYLNELREDKKKIENKEEKYSAKLGALKKEQKMLDKINKQLKIDYKDQIIVLE